METISDEVIVKQSFSDKYLTIFPKGKIWRLKYLGCMVLFPILLRIALLPIGIVLVFIYIYSNDKTTQYFQFFSIFLYQVLAVWIIWILWQKRINDIGIYNQTTRGIHAVILLFWFAIFFLEVSLPNLYRWFYPVHSFIFSPSFLLYLIASTSVLFILYLTIMPWKKQSSEIIK